jgi:hypothetical protein
MAKIARPADKKKAVRGGPFKATSGGGRPAATSREQVKLNAVVEVAPSAGASRRLRSSPSLEPGTSGSPEGSHLRRAFVKRGVGFLNMFAKRASDEAIAKALSEPTAMATLAQAMTSFVFEETALDARDQLIAAALAEGARYKEKLLEKAGGAYTAEQIAQVLGGKSRQAIADGRKTNLYFGVPVNRGYAYPKCQLTESGILPGLRSFLDAFSLPDPWMKFVVLLEPHPQLRGRSPLEALRAGEVEPAVEVAKSYGTHGA